MRTAIAIPFVIDQEEPSIPLPLLVWLEELDNPVTIARLKHLFRTYVCTDCPIEEIEVCTEKSKFGDITIKYDEMYLFLTYVK